jgi:hypothetical protein
MWKQKLEILDEVIIEHRDRYGRLIKRHKCNSGLVHKILKKLGLAHNSITAVGFADIVQLITGLSAPDPYTFLAIGNGTTADNVADTVIEVETAFNDVTPTCFTTTKTNDSAQWTHVFSAANDSLSGADAINEVGITSANTSYNLLIHIAGSVNYGAVDNCNWDAGDTLSVTINCQIKQGT